MFENSPREFSLETLKRVRSPVQSRLILWQYSRQEGTWAPERLFAGSQSGSC